MKTNVNQLNQLINDTLSLINIYQKNDISLPFGLKGNIGEFLVAKELIKKFPEANIDFIGGSFPGIDIKLDNVKIQVKTQFKHKPKNVKKGSYDFESSPTIKRDIIDKKKADIIVLVIIYTNDEYSKITKSNIYVFDEHDFKYFNCKGCWSGKSKGDYTIMNVLSVNGSLPAKQKELIDFYNNKNYRDLFEKSKDNWYKIKKIIR